MPDDGADDHDDNGDQEDENGYPVHPMHQEDIGIVRRIGIALTQVKIGEQLLPHNLLVFIIKIRNCLEECR